MQWSDLRAKEYRCASMHVSLWDQVEPAWYELEKNGSLN